ncbi:BZ3500_MvSof-1268-A1-R1_Chr7-3g09641 [Microbotryum saponariae]|uniref:BZ3500_MvSof-1268-A1-R1_Chr7-3g09641 protein n=1 Tax=Microbotryum saponariae TaxID=289078 RepID=A0A2X0L0T9_9BASI|nr:BZ3501_MvSof-1269-A2-R1_Chr7-2g09364 [Microbotryum saponariae]SDA02329.1 BZ3500_MvSof-1268-A1-R1_Chr7-3g09641 [Microbotryum saponariae]
MGLLTIIRKTRLKERQIRVLCLGLDNAGKTTIVRRLLGEDISLISPTLGFNIRTIVHIGYTLNIWDIGGQSSLRPYWRNYFEVTDAVIWVVDSSDRERMADCRDELHELLREEVRPFRGSSMERLAGASLLVLANKQDISGALTSEEIADALELYSLRSHTSTIIPCSARLEPAITVASSEASRPGDPRIWKGLDWIVTEVGRRVYYGVGNPLVAASSVKIPSDCESSAKIPSDC